MIFFYQQCFSRHGFNTPILVKEKTGLGITIPDTNFTVSDVRNFVGAKRMVDIMDCTTQKNTEMTMKEWEDYYTSTNRTRKLNVISLEFSQTKLESLVIAPKVVRQIDRTLLEKQVQNLQCFDHGFGEGNNHKNSVQYNPA